MAEIGTYNAKKIVGGNVTTSSINFDSLINNFVGSANNENNTIENKEVSLDLEMFIEDIEQNDKYNINDNYYTEPTNTAPWYERVGATLAVFGTSVLSGVADVVEHVVDGGAYIVAGTQSLLGFEDAAKTTRDFIATNWVDEANKAFYEETTIGQNINSASYSQYDSDFMQGVRNTTEGVTEFAAATALTVATGGSLAPFAVGTIVGLGKSAESSYQTNGTENPSIMQNLMILGGGALNGLSWFANGKLGQGFLKIGKTISVLGPTATKQIVSEVFTKKFLVQMLKKGLASPQAIMNYVASGLMMADEFIPYMTGKENVKDISIADIGRLSLIYLRNLGLNVLDDGMRDYVTHFKPNGTTISAIADILFEEPSKLKDFDMLDDSDMEKLYDTMAYKILNGEYSLSDIDDLSIEARNIILANRKVEVASYEEVQALQEIARREGMTLKEYGGQTSKPEGLTPDLQDEAHAWAQQVRATAEIYGPGITEEMQSLESDTRHLVGLSHYLKGEDSLERKIISDFLDPNNHFGEVSEAADAIGDSVRYTMLCDGETMTADITETVTQLINDGYTVEKFKNTFNTPTYKGINMTLQSPDGILIELQFHTAESFSTKEDINHLFYEIQRNLFTSEDATTLSHQIMERTAGEIDIPTGITEFKLSDALKDAFPNIEEIMSAVFRKEHGL